MIKDYNNITADDVRNMTDTERKSMTDEQREKYGIALKKYAMLNRIASKPLKFGELMSQLGKLEEINDDTTVEIKLKNEYNSNDPENFMSSKYCFVAYYSKEENKVVIQNYV